MRLPWVDTLLIVGGGIAGMALAIGLKRAGLRSEIVEINPHWTVAGLGIGLRGPALRALKIIGVLDECVERGFGFSQFNAADADGNIKGKMQLPRLNGPDYPAAIGIMRQALHSVLQQALTDAKIPIGVGVTVAALNQDKGVST